MSYFTRNPSMRPSEEKVEKANPYHGGRGRFSTSKDATAVSAGKGKKPVRISREKKDETKTPVALAFRLM